MTALEQAADELGASAARPADAADLVAEVLDAETAFWDMALEAR